MQFSFSQTYLDVVEPSTDTALRARLKHLQAQGQESLQGLADFEALAPNLWLWSAQDTGHRVLILAQPSAKSRYELVQALTAEDWLKIWAQIQSGEWFIAQGLEPVPVSGLEQGTIVEGDAQIQELWTKKALDELIDLPKKHFQTDLDRLRYRLAEALFYQKKQLDAETLTYLQTRCQDLRYLLDTTPWQQVLQTELENWFIQEYQNLSRKEAEKELNYEAWLCLLLKANPYTSLETLRQLLRLAKQRKDPSTAQDIVKRLPEAERTLEQARIMREYAEDVLDRTYWAVKEVEYELDYFDILLSNLSLSPELLDELVTKPLPADKGDLKDYGRKVLKGFYFGLLINGNINDYNLHNLQELGYLVESNHSPQELLFAYEKVLACFFNYGEAFPYALHRWARYYRLVRAQDFELQALNARYKGWADIQRRPYLPFTLKELDAISDKPSFSQNLAYFRQVEIVNFRRFRNLTLSNLGQFNLIVGDNNAGKTSILEALLVHTRIECYIRRLAYAYIDRQGIKPMQAQYANATELRYQLSPDFLKDFQGQMPDMQAWEVTAQNRWRTYQSRIDFFLDRIYDLVKKPTENLDYYQAIKEPYMPYGRGFDLDLARVYQECIALKPKEEAAFIRHLNCLIPKAQRIVADTSRGHILVLIEGEEEYRLLHQFGEGANKLFRILLMLQLNKGDKVLIDELDAGIHHSRFRAFWKVILQVARETQTQVFATTHNEECIRYFAAVLEEEAFQSYQEEARVVQITENKKGESVALSYTFDSFNYALERGLEIRGGE